jgi:hypothetical protein
VLCDAELRDHLAGPIGALCHPQRVTTQAVQAPAGWPMVPAETIAHAKDQTLIALADDGPAAAHQVPPGFVLDCVGGAVEQAVELPRGRPAGACHGSFIPAHRRCPVAPERRTTRHGLGNASPSGLNSAVRNGQVVPYAAAAGSCWGGRELEARGRSNGVSGKERFASRPTLAAQPNPARAVHARPARRAVQLDCSASHAVSSSSESTRLKPGSTSWSHRGHSRNTGNGVTMTHSKLIPSGIS